jgi:hypothetical protein
MDTLSLAEASGLKSADESLDAALNSVAVARLIEEVRSTDFEVTRAYNRTYNRHNR